MPDITMCASNICPKRTECYRHAESGTEPNPWRQAYFVDTGENENGCDRFSPQHTKKYVNAIEDKKWWAATK